jgi:very-short-patch-repair endonuclease
MDDRLRRIHALHKNTEADKRFTRMILDSLDKEVAELYEETPDWYQLWLEGMNNRSDLAHDMHFLTALRLKLSLQIMDRLDMFLTNALITVESPIEKYMLAGLVVAGYEITDGVMLVPMGSPQGAFCHPILSELWIEPQAQIGEYRVDFLVTWYKLDFEVNIAGDGNIIPRGKKKWNVIVECDGHDYHEKTKEQARRDKKRDRELQKVGYSVFRFTGSEIWKDTLRCAREVLQFLEKQAHSSST